MQFNIVIQHFITTKRGKVEKRYSATKKKPSTSPPDKMNNKKKE